MRASIRFAIFSGSTQLGKEAGSPLRCWQFVQWQYALRSGSPETSYETAPQKQEPCSAVLVLVAIVVGGVVDAVG